MAAGKAIVVGAGIAGLAVARGLVALGWDVTVYEQASSFAPVGAGITLAPNAVRALDWFGFGQALRAKSMAHGEAGIRTSSGRWLLQAEFAALQRRFGVPTFALHRADLHQMLVNGASGAAIRIGHQATGIKNGDRPVVTFETPDGPGENDADLVVGADGINSRIRAGLFPGHPGLSYAGYVTWRGVVPAHAVPPGVRDVGVTETWGRGKRFGIVPLGDGQLYWFATVSVPARSHERDTLSDVAGRYRGWHQPIPALLAATPPETLLRHAIYEVKPPLLRYDHGRIVLVGDAAHAFTPDIGQGGCQALEDAVALIQNLSSTADVDRAVAHFDHVRRRRTQHIARTSALWGDIAEWRNPVAAGVRNTLVRLVPPSLFLRASAVTLGWQPPANAPRWEGPAA